MSNIKKINKSKSITIAITGVNGLVGKNLLKALCNQGEIDTILAFDVKKPRIKNSKIIFNNINLIDDNSVEQISHILKKHKCKILVHAALPNWETKDTDTIHDFQVIGAMNILLASEMAGIHKIILSSTTDVYGAIPENPSFLTEEHTLNGWIHSKFLRDKINVENQFLRLQQRFKKSCVTILRPCTILGPNVKSFKSIFLKQPAVPTVLGFDPLVQFVHISDVIRAFQIVIKKDIRGIFNIIGDGVLPLSRALTFAGKTNFPIPSTLLKVAGDILWHFDVKMASSGHIGFLKYQCVADGDKAKNIMKFTPKYTSKEAVLSLRSDINLQGISYET